MEGRHSAAKHAAPSARDVPNSARPARSAAPEKRKTAAANYEDFEDEFIRPSRHRTEEPQRIQHTVPTPARREAPADIRKRERPVYARSRRAAGRILADIGMILLITAVILVVFAFFHHVLPRLTQKQTVVEPISTVTVTPLPVQPTEEHPEPSPPDEPEGPEQPEETQEPEVIDNRTEWQKKFADKFSDEVVITENSYTSPGLSITLETVKGEMNGFYQTYYVADIYIGSIENIRTYFANNSFTYYGEEDRNTISKHAGAILSINGDYCNNQKNGLLVRNGQVFYEDVPASDICALYYDGTVETFSPGQYEAADIFAKKPFQTWKFGPRLLNENGQVMDSFNTTSVIETEAAPRSGFGYYEPGHYCFVVADGRQNHARGLVLKEFAQIFQDLGCRQAYNMDGGASSVLYFNGKVFNKPSAVRALGDILLIAEAPEEGKAS